MNRPGFRFLVVGGGRSAGRGCAAPSGIASPINPDSLTMTGTENLRGPESARTIIPPEGLLAGGYREIHPNTPSTTPMGTGLPGKVPDDT